MSKLVLTNVRYFVGPADLTAQTNKVEVDATMEAKEVTNFGSSGKKEWIAGLDDFAIAAEGQWQSGDPGYADDEWWAARQVVEAHSVAPAPISSGLTAGDPMFTGEAVRLAGKAFGTVGEVAMFTLGAGGSLGLVRGACMQTPGTAISADGNGTAVQVGALSANQRLVASIHILSTSGTNPTLDVTIQSDTVSDFSGSPETRLTFAQKTTTGSEVVRGSVGAHADTWYRAVFDIGGTGGPSFLCLVVLGIQTMAA